jgi:hypothetical protein
MGAPIAAGLPAIEAGQDAVYANLGVAATWTPAGGAAVACTALVFGGDKPGQIKGLVAQLNLQAVYVRVREREIGLAAPGVTPLHGDQFSLGADVATPADQQTPYLISGDPRQEDPRRLEWTIELKAA